MTPGKTVIVAGATGFIGKSVLSALKSRGWTVIALSTNPQKAREKLGLEAIGFDGTELEDAVKAHGKVVRLSGVNPLFRRWSKAYKALMWQSRVDTAFRLATALAQSTAPDRVIVSAGGINICQPSENLPITETSPIGNSWVAGMLAAKECALHPARISGARAITLRIGLSFGRGGPLAFIDKNFRMGMGGHVGSGNQFVPWIHEDDLASMFVAGLENPAWNGPFIAAAPNPVTARALSVCIGAQLGRSSWFHMPAPMAHLVLGEMATLVLSSYRADPVQAKSLGFRFNYPTLDAALAEIYGTAAAKSGDAPLAWR